MRNRFAFGRFGAAAQRKATPVFCLALCFVGVGLSATAQERQATFVTVDDPGAGTGSFEGTVPEGTSPSGTIVGFVFDDNFVAHGFLRARDGTFANFDAPGAGTGSFEGTAAASIDPRGLSRDTTTIRALWLTALCVLRTVP